MALVYAQVGDPEVLRDYQAVLGPDPVVALTQLDRELPFVQGGHY